MDERALLLTLWIATIVVGAWCIAWGTHWHGIGRFGFRLFVRTFAVCTLSMLIGLVVVEFVLLDDVIEESMRRGGTLERLARTGPFVTSYYVSRPFGGIGMHRGISDPLFGAALYFAAPALLLGVISWCTLWIVTSRPTDQPSRADAA